MSTKPIDLHGSERTLLMSLHLHALDAQEPEPILGDTHAAQVLAQVEYDQRQLAGLTGNEELIVERARMIDDRVRAFLATHPGTTVAHLGCGLDSRSSRLDLSSTARWLDIDLPEVAELRRSLYPPRDGVEILAASATEQDWWDAVAGASPLLVVAEGLVMYLPAAEVDALLDRAERWPGGGAMVLDGVAPWVVRASGLHPAMRRADAAFRSAFDIDAVLRRHPRLRAVDSSSVTAALDTDSPTFLGRLAYRLYDLLRPLRNSMIVHELALPERRRD